MATTKAKKDRLDGTDRWTSKGYGITMNPPTAEQKARIAEVNRELEEARKAKKQAPKRTKKG